MEGQTKTSQSGWALYIPTVQELTGIVLDACREVCLQITSAGHQFALVPTSGMDGHCVLEVGPRQYVREDKIKQFLDTSADGKSWYTIPSFTAACDF